MRRWIVRLLVILGIVAAGLALRATVFAPKPIEVTVAEVSRGRVEQTVTNSRAGTVKARRRAQISPEVGGRVVEVPFREGDAFKKGDVLLRLNASVPAARIVLSRREMQAAEAQRQQACAAAERAVRERGRLKKLAAEGIVSTDALDQAETAAETTAAACRAARAGVEQARAAVELAAREEGLTVIRAPFDGIVADLSVEVGEYTTPSPPGLPIPPVIDVLDPGSIYVSAPMDEVDSARIHPGQTARVTFDSYPGRQFAGRVRKIAPYVLDREEQNRTVEIEVELDHPESVRLLPGTSADVEVLLQARENVLRIPTSALIEGEKVLVSEKGVLAERKLGIGLKNWDWTEIRSGLAPGDLVVVSLDRPEVQAGAKVTTVRQSSAP
ncbi:MAG TPA: efflux RND transporter periplasmic adaptor subunit [Thermoanaerobaculia bacterium]|jgi:HlyD family secretion protein|nr:efflux RND transporter periplasmic adaptor subunit [Thermoanaerobaculia bacterium]